MKFYSRSPLGLKKRGFTIGEYSFELVNFKMPYIDDQYRQRNFFAIMKGPRPLFEIVYYTRRGENE